MAAAKKHTKKRPVTPLPSPELIHQIQHTVYDVCIVGMGAAGLAAAIQAARDGASVLGIEVRSDLGQTILATGNGRCNFSHTCLSPQAYNHPEFVAQVGKADLGETVQSFFRSLGLMWTEEDGRLYPYSRHAGSVQATLKHEVDRLGISSLLCAQVRTIRTTPSSIDTLIPWIFEVVVEGLTESIEVHAQSLVLATKTIVSPFNSFNISETPIRPVLCPLHCVGTHEDLLEQLDGHRIRCLVRGIHQGKTCFEEVGEVLFRTYGLSGIVIFNASRAVMPGDTIQLDLLYGLDEDAVTQSLAHGNLDGIFDPITAETLRQAGLTSLVALKTLTFEVEGFDTTKSQVRRGGIACSELREDLGIQRVPGLFCAGEIIDIDGACGGYNLGWAWISGMVAGSAAYRFAVTHKDTL